MRNEGQPIAMLAGFTTRWATEADARALRHVISAAIERLQSGFLSSEQVAASRAVMGLDTQLVRDGTYLVVEEDGALVGCGGWSWRATLYGGDDGAVARDAARLDPSCQPARIRAMYTHPDHARRGIGRLILDRCETAAAASGFGTAELMATMSGRPLYAACGYREIERHDVVVDGITVPLALMRKPLSRVAR